MTCMYDVLRSIETHRDVYFSGQVPCIDGVMDEAADGDFIRRLSHLWRRLRDSRPARRVLSPLECAYRPITIADCPERMSGVGTGEDAA